MKPSQPLKPKRNYWECDPPYGVNGLARPWKGGLNQEFKLCSPMATYRATMIVHTSFGDWKI